MHTTPCKSRKVRLIDGICVNNVGNMSNIVFMIPRSDEKSQNSDKSKVI